MIIGCLSILNIEVYEPCKEQGQLKMDNTTKALLFLMLYVPPIIIGGIIAYKKGDFLKSDIIQLLTPYQTRNRL